MANQFVIADSNACIGCKTCMAACLAKHDVPGDAAVPRLNLITTLNVSAPIVCHHCEDAPCVHACPTGALYHDGDRVAVNEARCIGCRGCVMACPFGAVQVVAMQTTTTFGNLIMEGSEKPLVIKCDLCKDRPGGPACIEACPTKGLMLMDWPTIEEGRKRRERHAAEEVGKLAGTLKSVG